MTGTRVLSSASLSTGLYALASRGAAVDKLRKMLAFLQEIDGVDELRTIPVWKAHQLTGDRKGIWSLYVTRNWRLTFRVDGKEIVDIDFEDYH